MKELLAQLRELATGGDCRYMDTCNEAADALERLTAENAQLIGEMADQGPCINNLRDRIVGLTAERDALKEGLDGWHQRCIEAEEARDEARELASVRGQRMVEMRFEIERLTIEKEAWTDHVAGYNLTISELTAERDALRARANTNRAIRNNVDSLLAQRGYTEDSSSRHQLACMNFDASIAGEAK